MTARPSTTTSAGEDASVRVRRTPHGVGPALAVAVMGLVIGVNAQILTLATLDVARDLGFTVEGIIKFAATTGAMTLGLSVAVAHRADRTRRVTIVGAALVGAGIIGMLAALAGSPLTLGAAVVGADVLIIVAAVPTVSLLADWYPQEVRGRVFAFVGLGQALGAALAFVVAGEVIDALGWRGAHAVLFGPIAVVGVAVLIALREPPRGFWERKALGASDEAARQEDAPVSFGEAWRTVWSIRVLRRIVVSNAFTEAGALAYGTALVLLLIQEYRYDPGDLGWFFAGAAGFAVPAAIIGGRVVDRLARRDPGRLLNVFAAYSAVAGVATVVAPFRPPAGVLLAATGVFVFGSALLGPALGAVYASVTPPHVRTVGGSLRNLTRLPGLLIVLPLVNVVIAEYSLASALIVPVPFLLAGALAFLGAAPLYELDARAAAARALAADRARAIHDAEAPVLVCRGLDVARGEVSVLHGVDFEVEPGEIVAVWGQNGAGKSTLLRALAGYERPTGGGVTLDGRDVTFMPAHERARRGLIFAPGEDSVFADLTVAENLTVGGWLTGDAPEALERLEKVLSRFPSLAERLDTPAGELSTGEQRMLSLALGLVADARLLLIDELTLGLAPLIAGELRDVLRDVSDDGVAVVLAEPSFEIASEFADRMVVMEQGEVVFSGETAAVRRHLDIVPSVRHARLLSARTAPRHPATSDDDATAVLEVEGVTRSFGGVVALDGVDLAVQTGEIVALVGANGSGKTTLLDVVSGLITPDGGRVRHGGVDITELSPEARAARGVLRRFQDARMFPALTVGEVVTLAVQSAEGAGGIWRTRRTSRSAEREMQRVLELLELPHLRDEPVGALSTGTRRLVDMACVLAVPASVVLLDEPSAGVERGEAEFLVPLLRRIRDDSGSSMLLVEHDLSLVAAVADRVVALDLGDVVASGLPADVLADDGFVSGLLGAGVGAGVGGGGR